MYCSRWVVLYLFVFVVFLSGCSRIVESEPSQASGSDILRDAKPIPLAAAQALSLSYGTYHGLSAMGSFDVATVQAIDLKGYPFVNVTITAPRDIGDPWQFARQLTGNEWAGDDDDSLWTVTVTGATEARDMFSSFTVGLDFLIKGARTIEKLGGHTKLKEFVAFMPTSFFFRDTSGNLWYIEEERKLTAEEVRYITEMYDEIYEANNSPESSAQQAEEWQAAFTQMEENFKYLDSSLEELTQTSGSFDLARFQQVATSFKATRRLPPEECDPTLRIARCARVLHGAIPDNKQASQGGFIQRWDQYNRRETDAFRMPHCAPLTGLRLQSPLGCGPSAFIGLVGRKYISHNLRLYNTTNSQSRFMYIKERMTDPLGYRGCPVIANYMGTCWNTGGSMTWGKGFRDGGNDFLREQGSSLRVIANISHKDGNAWSKQAKADVLLREIGDRENPVVAEYWTGAFSAHFAAVKAYHLYVDSGGGLLEVSVRTVDHSRSWYTLSGKWVGEVGLFYLN